MEKIDVKIVLPNAEIKLKGLQELKHVRYKDIIMSVR